MLQLDGDMVLTSRSSLACGHDTFRVAHLWNEPNIIAQVGGVSSGIPLIWRPKLCRVKMRRSGSSESILALARFIGYHAM